MGGGGQGQPNHFQCSACRRRKPWHPRVDPEAYRKGLINRIKLTGRAKAIGDGRASGRSTNTRIEYECLDCGHLGWSRHVDVFRKAVRQWLKTPGEDGPAGRRAAYEKERSNGKK